MNESYHFFFMFVVLYIFNTWWLDLVIHKVNLKFECMSIRLKINLKAYKGENNPVKITSRFLFLFLV